MAGLSAVDRSVVDQPAVDAHGFRTDGGVLDAIAGDLAGLVGRGVRVVLVSSGAVAHGRLLLHKQGITTGTVEHTQAAAALGQPVLMSRWVTALAKHGVRAGQVLVTADDFEHRVRYVSGNRRLEILLEAGCIAVVNENDSVAFDRMRLGDNDRLSALVARSLGADALLMLSVAAGLEDDSGRVIAEVTEPNDAARFLRSDVSDAGTGGMATKLDAAALATDAGCVTVIAGGHEPGVVRRVMAGELVGTVFRAAGDGGDNARRRWIGAAARVEGTVYIDRGAVRALRETGASLLPIGVVRIDGRFDADAAVDIAGPDGAAFARGLAALSSTDMRRTAGMTSDEIQRVLGVGFAAPSVHRDNLVIFSPTHPDTPRGDPPPADTAATHRPGHTEPSP